MVLTNSTNQSSNQSRRSRAKIGRKKKGTRRVTPPTTLSSPAKAASESLLLGTLAEVKTAPKEVKLMRVQSAIHKLLDKVFESNTEEKTECIQGLLEGLQSSEGVLPPPITVVSPNRFVPYDKNAFLRDNKGNKRTGEATRQYKKRKIDQIASAVSSIGNAQQQLLVLHGYLKRSQGNLPVVDAALQSVAYGPDMGLRIVENIRQIMRKGNTNTRLDDFKTFRNTVLMAAVPQVLPNRKSRKIIAKALGIKETPALKKQIEEAVEQRKLVLSSNTGDRPLIQQYKSKGRKMFSVDFILQLHQWILYKCDLVVPSPCSNHSIIVKDVVTGDKKREQRYYYISSVRDLHNELVKPYPVGFPGATVEGKIVISDTMLRSLLPRQLTRLTDSQKMMCGCEICIVSKEFVQTLNAFVNRTMKELESAIDKPSTDADLRMEHQDDYIELQQFFKTEQGIPKFEKPRDIIAMMTCQPTLGLWKMNCALGRCRNCPALDVPDLLMQDGEAARDISYQCYEYHSYCTKHKSLEGSPTTCSACKELKETDEEASVGKLLRKLHLTRKRSSTGVFMKQFFLPMMAKARFHQLHVALLGKNHCTQLRQEVQRLSPNSISTQRDYADALVAEYEREIQSTHFGENAKVSMEGVTVRFGTSGFHYHCYIADDKRQDARTTFVNQESLVHHVREKQGLLTPGSVMYETMDGCSKQYRCATALYLMSSLAYQYGITIDRMIQAPHHGKGDCDSQGGIDKNHLRRYFRTIATPEVDAKFKIEAHTVNEFGKRSSMAERMAKILADPTRCSGLKGHNKHAKRESNARIQHCFYHVMHHGNTDSDETSPLPFLNTKFEYSGYPSISGQTQNGMMSHYHFIAVPGLGVGKVASRRIPCACTACRQQLGLPWDLSKMAIDQPMFQAVQDCKYQDVLQGLNDWKIITVYPSASCKDPEEILDLFDDILGEHESRNSRLIKLDSFGAYSGEDGYYVVKWTSEPYALERDTEEVEGLEADTVLLSGSIVVKGVYWNDVPRARLWFTPPPRQRRLEKVFRVRYVISPDITLEDPSDAVVFPLNRRDRAEVMSKKPKRITENCHDEIMAQLALRARLDFEEDDGVDDGVEGVERDQEEGAEEESGAESGSDTEQ